MTYSENEGRKLTQFGFDGHSKIWVTTDGDRHMHNQNGDPRGQFNVYKIAPNGGVSRVTVRFTLRGISILVPQFAPLV